MKKVMSVFLSLAMLVTMAVSVGAASPDETTDNEQIEVTPRYSFTNNTNTLISSKTVDDVKVICPYGSVTGYRDITTQIMHVVGNGNSDTLFLTEGVMKSDIASYLSGGSLFVGLTGVNNTRFLAEVIGMLRPRIIVECIDMDKRYNPHVMKAMENIRAICIPLCQNYQPFDWPDRFKGIDDYYLAQRMQQDKAA